MSKRNTHILRKAVAAAVVAIGLVGGNRLPVITVTTGGVYMAR